MAATGCSSGSSGSNISVGGGANAGGTSGGNSGGTSGTFFGGNGGTAPAGGTNTGGNLGDADTCVGETQAGEGVPVDMFAMIDTSGSMDGDASGGGTKWSAVQSALIGFIDDPKSNGLGVGLQFFPKPKAGVPAMCTSNAQCGTGGPCFLKACFGAGLTQLFPCDSVADCPGGAQCAAWGICSADPTLACRIGSPSDPTCGTCTPQSSSICINRDSCEQADYRNPAVSIAALPGNATALKNAINAKMPDGATPTSASLQGAIGYAQTHAQANPNNAVFVLLVTDGVPTRCDTDINNIGQIASQGANGNPNVKTFVIGVFGPGDAMGTANANAIAQAGGTDTAYIVDPSAGNVSQQFFDALEKIRGQQLSCEFLIPKPPPGEQLNYNQVNVEFTNGQGGTTTIPFVGSAASCDAQNGGWYYDTDPLVSPPTKISLCPTSCGMVEADPAGAVDYKLGCGTVTVPK